MANIMEKQFYKQRSDFDKSCIERDKKLTMPEGVEYTENIAYTNDGNPSHQLDIYRPKDREGEVLPVIINVHGGGLIIGNKGFNKYFCSLLCKKGFLVYSIEYRLIPDCMIYDQFKDALNFRRGSRCPKIAFWQSKFPKNGSLSINYCDIFEKIV